MRQWFLCISQPTAKCLLVGHLHDYFIQASVEWTHRAHFRIACRYVQIDLTPLEHVEVVTKVFVHSFRLSRHHVLCHASADVSRKPDVVQRVEVVKDVRVGITVAVLLVVITQQHAPFHVWVTLRNLFDVLQISVLVDSCECNTCQFHTSALLLVVNDKRYEKL